MRVGLALLTTRIEHVSSARLKTAGPTKQEAARIDVENAEDDLVQKTEVAITLMKTVLENVSCSLKFTSMQADCLFFLA